MRGPRPSHFPQFTAEQVQKARCVVRRYSSAYQRVQRARLALLLAERPLVSHVEAAREVGLSVPAVRKWRRRWCRHGFSLEDAPRPGRPCAFSPGAEGDGQGDRL